MNELVKYNNQMNKLSFTGFSKTHMDLFMALCSKMKMQGTKRVRISTQELKEITCFEKGGRRDFFEELDEMTDRLQYVNGKIVDRTPGQRKFRKFTLFPTFEYDENEGWLDVQVNDSFSWLLNEFENYTTFELAEFVNLKSKYSKNLYRLLKQWRTEGRYEFHDIAKFRELMDIPKSYTNRQVMQDCVSVAIKEISELDGSFKNFKCEPIYARKRGKPLDKLIFTWQPEKPQWIDYDQIEGQQSFGEQDFAPEASELAATLDEGDIEMLVRLMKEHSITYSQAKEIYKSAEGDMSQIVKVYEYCKNRKSGTDNLVGLMIALVKPGVFQEPIKTAPKTSFNNFTPSRNVDYDELERKLLEASMPADEEE